MWLCLFRFGAISNKEFYLSSVRVSLKPYKTESYILFRHQTGEEARTSREDGPNQEENMNKDMMRSWGGAALRRQV